MESDYDYNENTSDEDCEPDTWDDEDEEEKKKEITYKVCCVVMFIDNFQILLF